MNGPLKGSVLGTVVAVVLACLGATGATGAERQALPVLGSKEYAPNGYGFGAVKPKKIYNGGVPNGLVVNVRWSNWGGKVAYGRGKGYGYKPSGGYYEKKVNVRFKAKRLGRCPGENRLAYTRLLAKFQKKPGGKAYTKWFRWSGSDSTCSF